MAENSVSYFEWILYTLPLRADVHEEILSILRTIFSKVRFIILSSFADLNSLPKDQKIKSGTVKNSV